jgi:hypothetical protein
MMLANLSAVEACVLRLEDVAIQESTLMAPPRISTDFDFLDPDVSLAGLTVAELAELRESEPIHWVDVPDGCGCFEDNGCSPTNPINVPYCQRFGFQAIGELALPGRGPVITNMWREARL